MTIDSSHHTHSSSHSPKEKDTVPFFPVVLAIFGFFIFLSTTLAVVWFVYQNYMTQEIIKNQSVSGYLERDLLRQKEQAVLQKHLSNAMQVVLRKYESTNPAVTTAPLPHTGPPDSRFSIFPKLKTDIPLKSSSASLFDKGTLGE